MAIPNVTIVDVETTGGSAAFGRVIEIGILRIEKDELVEKYKTFVNPGQPIPEFITELTGIAERHVKKAPYFEEIAEDLLPLFEDSIFVAHNSSFDYKFLQTEFARAGLVFNMPSLCTVRLSRALYPEYKKHNLSAIIERFDFECKNRHRAFDDAKVLWDFLQLIQRDHPSEIVSTAFNRTLKKIAPRKQQKMGSSAGIEIEYIEDFV